MKITDRGRDFIKKHEGLKLEAYKDAAGIWTVGYGHTGTAKPGMIITKEQAEQLLTADIEKASKAIRNAVKVQLLPHEFDALVSLVFNIGAGAFQKSTLLKRLNEGQKQAAADEFLRWRYSGGQVLPGLVKRRRDERGIFLNGYTGGVLIALVLVALFGVFVLKLV